MKLILDLISGGRPGGEQRSFDHRGLTIGRGGDCDWVLDDPSRFLSKSHCFIDYVDGSYVLFDLSTNGTFVNGGDSPLGRANSMVLSDGDRITMGDHQLVVRMSGEEAPAAAHSIDVDDPMAYPFGAEPNSRKPIAEPLPGWGAEPKAEDPFAFPSSSSEADQRWARPAEPDHLPGPQVAFRPPAPKFDEIPEDWAETPEPAPERGRAPARPIPSDWSAAPAQRAPAAPPPVPPAPRPAEPPPLPVEPPTLAIPPDLPASDPFQPSQPPPRMPQPAAIVQAPIPEPQPMPVAAPMPAPAASPAPVPAANGDLIRVMLQAAGMDPSRFPADRGPEIAALFGEIVRTSVQGLIEALNARSALKAEFRIERTSIQPRNNNPLKFSTTAAEAVTAILSPPLPAFAKGADAIAEGFRDLHEHQIGTVSGMEQALRHLLDTLAPAAVEASAGSGGLGDVLPGGRKARLWDAYVALHQRTIENASNNIREVFGKSFAEGYDKQKDRV